MIDSILKIAEQKITEAIKNGELDNLPGQGKPLDLNDMRGVPPELRMEYKVLKNSGMIPEELSVKNEIAHLEDLLKKCQTEDEEKNLREKIAEKNIYYNILMEKRRKKIKNSI